MKGVKQRAAMNSSEPIDDSPVEHPAVRTHPVTGRQALWLTPGFVATLCGFEEKPSEGEALLERLKKHLTQPHLIYTHEWQPHDVIFWDNRCVTHARDTWDRNCLREMHRSQAGGSRPFQQLIWWVAPPTRSVPYSRASFCPGSLPDRHRGAVEQE